MEKINYLFKNSKEKLEEKIEDKNEENEKEVVQQQDKRRKILICCSGSVACVKIPLIYSHLILFTEVLFLISIHYLIIIIK